MDWETEGIYHHDINSGFELKPLEKGEFYFDFPLNPGHVNAIQKRWNKPVRVGSTVTINYRIRAISGTPTFRSLDKSAGLPPNCRPMIFNGDWASSWGRMWPEGNNCIILSTDDAIKTYMMKLDPKQWTGVNGQHDPTSFKNVCQHVYAFQIVFGGGNSFSHGARGKDGVARFELISFTVK